MRLLALVAALAAGALIGFAPGAAGHAANTQTYADPAGDSNGAPDITSLTISDSATGVVQFAFTVTGMVSDSSIDLFLDADRNVATGDSGYDHQVELSVFRDGTRHFDVMQYVNGDWVDVAFDNSMGMTISGDVWTVRAGKAALGGTTGFIFWGGAAVWDASDNLVALDRVPDGGQLTYDLSPTMTTTPATVVSPWIGTPTISPLPKAGKTVTVVFPVTDKATGAPLTSGTMTCDPRLNGKVLAHRESFGNGAATLRFTLPKTAKGKTLKVNLTIRVGTKSIHRVATFRVK